MIRIARIIFTVVIGMSFIGSCFAEESPAAAKLIKAARIYLQEENKEKAIATLDVAFDEANSAGDYDALMEIGDLYVTTDPNLKEKAMEAWNTAGRWKIALP